MRLRAYLVDDEPLALARLRRLLEETRRVDVIGSTTEPEEAVEVLTRAPPDMCFLDIQMPRLNGFEVLARVPQQPIVVFTTAYDQYALRAFEVHAQDYLLKPFDDERFRCAVAHAKQQVRQGKLGRLSDRLVALLDGVARPPAVASNGQYLKRLAIKAGGRVTILGVKDIDWIEAEGDYVKIHAGRAWHLLRETMKHLEAQFDPARFVRIHRSTIVNVERIKELQPYFRGEYVVVLHDGTSLKLSRGYKEHLEAALGRTF